MRNLKTLVFALCFLSAAALAQTIPGGGGGSGSSGPCSSFGTTAGTCLQGAGALGTPASGVATNLTGTAASLTAGAVTNNANLTGPITSTGNATAIASQTGTGTTFVTSVSPTLTGSPLVPTPAATDNSTKIASTAYVTTGIANAIAAGNPAVAVQAATTAAGDTSAYTYSNGVSGIGATLTGVVNTALTVDGFTFTAVGQRLLVKNDTQSPSGAFNGIYNVTQVQTGILPLILTRALDYDQPSDMNNTGAIPVINGTANGTTQWVITSTVNTVGTDPATFVKFSSNPASQISLSAANVWSAQQSNSIKTLTISTATFTPDGSQNNYVLTLVHASCPCTLANPSATPVAGTSGIIEVIQSATGSDTIGTYGSQYIAAGSTATGLTLSTAANAQDYMSYFVIDSTHILLSVGALNATH